MKNRNLFLNIKSLSIPFIRKHNFLYGYFMKYDKINVTANLCDIKQHSWRAYE